MPFTNVTDKPKDPSTKDPSKCQIVGSECIAPRISGELEKPA